MNNIKSFEPFLKAMEDLNFDESIRSKEDIMETFSSDDKVDYIVNTLTSDKFNGKISSAKFVKIFKDDNINIQDMLYASSYLSSNSKKMYTIKEKLNSMKARKRFKKSSFKDLIAIGKHKKIISPSFIFNTNFNDVSSVVQKYLLCNIFSSWKEQNFISSFNVDDCGSGWSAFQKRLSITFRAAANRLIQKPLKSNAIYKANVIYKSYSYMTSYSLFPLVNLSYSLEINDSICSRYKNGFFKICKLFTSDDRLSVIYENFNGFLSHIFRFFNDHICYSSLKFQYGYRSYSSFCITLNVSSESTSPVPLFASRSQNLFYHAIKNIDIMKNSLSSLSDTIDTSLSKSDSIVDHVLRFLNSKEDVLTTYQYFKFLKETFKYICEQGNGYRIKGNSIFGILNQFSIQISTIFNILQRDEIPVIKQNNLLIMYLSFISQFSSLKGDIYRTGIVLPLYSDDIPEDDKINRVYGLLSYTKKYFAEASTEDKLSGRTINSFGIHDFCYCYLEYLKCFDKDDTAEYDLTDGLLLFRHVNDLIVNISSSIPEEYDLSKFMIINSALKKIDNASNDEVVENV